MSGPRKRRGPDLLSLGRLGSRPADGRTLPCSQVALLGGLRLLWERAGDRAWGPSPYPGRAQHTQPFRVVSRCRGTPTSRRWEEKGLPDAFLPEGAGVGNFSACASGPATLKFVPRFGASVFPKSFSSAQTSWGGRRCGRGPEARRNSPRMGAEEPGPGGTLGGDPRPVAPEAGGTSGTSGTSGTRRDQAGPGGAGAAGLGRAAGPRPVAQALMDWLVRGALCAEPIRKHLPR